MFHNSTAVARDLQGAEPDDASRRRSGVNDFYFGMPGLRVPDGQHPDGRQVGRRDVSRARSRLRRSSRRMFSARRRRRARGRLLARRPRTCRCPRTGSPSTATATSTSPTRPNNEEPKRAALRPAQAMLSHLGHAPGPRAPADELPQERHPVAGVAHQAGTVPLRHRPGDVGARRRTARRTSSTTSMSSTRASSRASAR